MIRFLVDGIAFQKGQPRPAVPWREVLQALALRAGLHGLMLDRGGAPVIDRIALLPFPTHLGRDCAADSLLIQQMAYLFGVDVFLSTGWTTPVATPAVVLVPAMEPPPPQRDRGRQQLEHETALAYAQHYLCIGEHTRSGLRAAFPEVPEHAIDVVEPEAEALSGALAAAIDRLHRDHGAGRYKAFLAEWQRLRTVQASVDH